MFFPPCVLSGESAVLVHLRTCHGTCSHGMGSVNAGFLVFAKAHLVIWFEEELDAYISHCLQRELPTTIQAATCAAAIFARTLHNATRAHTTPSSSTPTALATRTASGPEPLPLQAQLLRRGQRPRERVTVPCG